MSQPPYPSQPQDPYSGQQGYPPPGIPQQPPGYQAPPPPDAGYGQPQYGSQPPQYGSQPPQYGSQPEYGSTPPQYGTPQPTYGGPPPSVPPKKSNVLKIVLIVVGVVALLCVAGVGVAFFAAKDKVEQVVDAASIRVSEPATLGGRAKVTDPTVAGSVASLDSAMAGVPGATGSVGAVYGDIQEQDLLMVAAASSVSGSAQSRYDEFTAGLTSGQMDVSNLADTDPGPLGGIAKCGDTDAGGVPMAICVWSDNGSVGMFAMMFKEKADLEKEFIALRGEVEQKS